MAIAMEAREDRKWRKRSGGGQDDKSTSKGGRANENEGQKQVGFDKRYPKQIKTWSQKVDLSRYLPFIFPKRFNFPFPNQG